MLNLLTNLIIYLRIKYEFNINKSHIWLNIFIFDCS